jgi:SAM-dependent methyltransferase
MTPNFLQKIYRKIEIIWEKLNGLDFSTVIPVLELGLDESLVGKGSSSCNKYLIQLFNALNITSNDRILDVGCAKGSAIRCMSKFPFSKIDGIEISDILSNIATNNFARLNEKRVEIKNIDASVFSGYRNYNFLYFYNPFPEEVMSKVLIQIQSQINSKKELIIIYNNPVCHEQVLNHGFYKIKEFPDMWNNGIFIYSNINQ